MRKTTSFLATMNALMHAKRENTWLLSTGLSRRVFNTTEMLMIVAVHVRDLGLPVQATPDEEALTALADEGIVILHREDDESPVHGIDLNMSGMQAIADLKNFHYDEFITAVHMVRAQ